MIFGKRKVRSLYLCSKLNQFFSNAVFARIVQIFIQNRADLICNGLDSFLTGLVNIPSK